MMGDNLPCADPEGCRHFKGEQSLFEDQKRLAKKKHIGKKALEKIYDITAAIPGYQHALDEDEVEKICKIATKALKEMG